MSWSESIPKSTISKVSKETGYTEFEIILSAVSYALEQDNYTAGLDRGNQIIDNTTSKPKPTSIHTTIRSIPSENIFEKSKLPNNLVSFNLTLQSGPADKLMNIRKTIASVEKNQPIRRIIYWGQYYFGCLTKCLPLLWSNVLLKYLTKRFAVTITEIRGENNNLEKSFVTLWGDDVCDLVYFQPPQANISEYILNYCYSVFIYILF